MRRLATIAWEAPPPAFVDEVLVLYDDGSAWLVVRRPREAGASIGTWVAAAPADDAALLAAAGPGPITLPLFSHRPDPALAPISAAADRVAEVVRGSPRAVATFHARAMQRPGDGELAIGLLVVAEGTVAVQFDLEPARCAVHFSGADGPLAWQEFPPLKTGFVTPEASGLGGLHRRAVVTPGAPGALTIRVIPPPGATALAVQVAGWLSEALTDEPRPEPYDIRTAETPIPGA